MDNTCILEIPIERIEPNPRQPRDIFDEEALEDLATSISEVGLLQPIVVRATGEETYEWSWERAAGEPASSPASPKSRAIVRSTQEDKLLLDALIENLQREQLNALQEAAAYRQLLDDFGATHEQLATRVGRSRSHVTNTPAAPRPCRTR